MGMEVHVEAGVSSARCGGPAVTVVRVAHRRKAYRS